MVYKVIKIEEDLDFGCEERTQNVPLLAVVTLEDEKGEVKKYKFPDAELLREDIKEQDQVLIDEKGCLVRMLQEDWTKNCTAENVDIPRFVSMMQRAREGEEVPWICPFCGGEVKRLSFQKGHTEIGCTSCDMRINLDTQ